MNLFDPILHLYFTFDPEKNKVLEEMGFFRQKLFNLEQMILSEEMGPAVAGYGWVFVVNVTVVPLSKAVALNYTLRVCCSALTCRMKGGGMSFK